MGSGRDGATERRKSALNAGSGTREPTVRNGHVLSPQKRETEGGAHTTRKAGTFKSGWVSEPVGSQEHEKRRICSTNEAHGRQIFNENGSNFNYQTQNNEGNLVLDGEGLGFGGSEKKSTSMIEANRTSDRGLDVFEKIKDLGLNEDEETFKSIR